MTSSTRRGYLSGTSPTGFPWIKSWAKTGPYSRKDAKILFFFTRDYLECMNCFLQPNLTVTTYVPPYFIVCPPNINA